MRGDGQAGDTGAEYGVFRTRQDALHAFRALLDAGFPSDMVGMDEGAIRASTRRSSSFPATAEIVAAAHSHGWVAAVSGALVGGVFCELSWIAVPGGGYVQQVGPFAAVLLGVIAGAAIGGATGALIGSIFPMARGGLREPLEEANGASVVLRGGARSERARAIVRAAGGAIRNA